MGERGKKEDNYLLTFADVRLLCRQSKRKIQLGALIFAVCAGLFALSRPINYKALATFREKGKSTSETTSKGLTIDLLTGAGGGANENTAISFLKSRKLFETVILKRNLQASIFEEESKLIKPFKNIRDNLKVEYALLRDILSPILKDPAQEIKVSALTYKGEVPLHLEVHFTSENTYVIKNKQSGEIGVGQLGTLFVGPQYSFVLGQESQESLSNRDFKMVIDPLYLVAERLSKQLKVEPDTKDRTLLRLSYQNRSRQEASDFLNMLMAAYQSFLKEEHQRIASEQIAYLEFRQQASTDKLKEMMEEHVHSLSANMATVDFLFQNQQSYTQKQLLLELELRRLQKVREEGLVLYDRYWADGGDALVINQMLNDIRAFRQQADAIALALEKVSKENREPLALQEFQGIDLSMANQLYMQYCKAMNDIEADILHRTFILDQMKDPHFEPSSLSAILEDPVSREMIARASNLVLTIKDQDNRSQKELERVRAELTQQKGFLAQHVEQMKQLLHLQHKQFQDKLLSLQNVQHELIKEKVAVLENHIVEYIDNRITNLKQEQEALAQQQFALQKEMEKMPIKWASERLIDQQLELNRKTIEEIARLVETKNISAHLDISQSSPVDRALPPIHPVSSKFILFALLGAITGALILFSVTVGRASMKGLPASPDNLRLLGQDVLGSLSGGEAFSDQDLDVMRHLSAHLCADDPLLTGRRDLLLLISRGIDYSTQLATLMSKSGHRVIVLSLFTEESSGEGLLQYLEGKLAHPPISRHPEGFDQMASGGVSRYATELIESQRFNDLMMRLHEEYEWIIAVSRTSPVSGEAEHLLNRFDRVVVTINDEKLQDLSSCLAIGSQPYHRLSFLFGISSV